MHRIEVGETLDTKPGQIHPRLIDVAGSCPPEDIGGPPGFEMFKQAVADPKHPEHSVLKECYGGTFDPDTPESDELRLEVLKLAKRWKTKNKTRN